MKKKGFTLIELLAVIVILAIIALIATPIVMNVIEGARKGAAERSAENYLRAVEIAIAQEMMENKLEDGTYSIDKDGNLTYKNKTIKVEIGSYEFTSGVVKIENGKVKGLNLINDKQTIIDGVDQSFDKWNGKEKIEPENTDGNYHITKASELAWLAQEVNGGNTFEGKNIYLENNIDLNNKEWTPIGTGTNNFKGNFYGNENMIKNIFIKKEFVNSDENKFLGLFGYTMNNTISDLNISNCNITGYANFGCLIGKGENTNINNINIFNAALKGYANIGSLSGNIRDCKNCGNFNAYNVTVQGTGKFIGGVIGVLNYSKITNIYTNATVDGSGSTERLSGVGGIIGVVYSEGDLDNLISDATVKGYSDVGGVVGHFQKQATLKNSVSYAKVEGTDMVGGVIGCDSANEVVNNLENIESYATVIGTGESIGGVVAHISQGVHNYKNIYSKSNVSGNNNVGGIIGGSETNYATLLNYKNIKSESIVTGNTPNVGELYGYIDSKFEISPIID